MKKITLQNYTTDTYYSKIVKAVASILASETVVTSIKLFVAMELLEQKDVEHWRKGQVPYLEKAIQCNLAKASRILRTGTAEDERDLELLRNRYGRRFELRRERCVLSPERGSGPGKEDDERVQKLSTAHHQSFSTLTRMPSRF